jgi:hypothetical protein
LSANVPRIVFAALVVALPHFYPPVRAQELPAPEMASQQNSGATLTIRFADAGSRFHVGEVIPLELSFSASAPDTFQYSNANYDRSGRLDMEQFHVTPASRDPLRNYYSTLQMIIGGGLSSSGVLKDTAYVIHEQLNEWIAPDRPGHYSVYVTSGRVNHMGADRCGPMMLQSNSLEFDVVEADAAWQQETLSSAMAILRNDSGTAEQKAAAVRVLRFLDSPGSIRELVSLLGIYAERGHWDEIAGLAGSRNPKLALTELERGMNTPDVAVTQDYLYILGNLEMQVEYAPLPPYPEKDPAQQKIWREEVDARGKQWNELSDALYEKAAAVALGKSSAARTETVRTLLMRPTREAGTARPLTNLPPDEVASAFLNLSPDAQWNVLSTFWARLKIPAMAEPLEKIARQPAVKNQMLRNLVIQCLYDLDPKAATPIILEEISHPHLDDGRFTVKGETLGLLPNETLPQFDEMLGARIEQKGSRTVELDANLIARYSTNAILSKVKSAYESALGQWDCATEDGFVLYFLRVDPDYGVKRLAVAPSFCMTNSLPAVIKMHRWNEVEPGIIARLNGADLNRAGQAAQTLAQYGSPQSEAAVWDRLRRFHAQWEARSDALVYRPDKLTEANEALSLQSALVQALGGAQAWLLTDEDLTALENLAIGSERENVKQWRWSSPVTLYVNVDKDRIFWNIKQVSANDLTSLLAKVAQYPAGTDFMVNISGAHERTASVSDALYEVGDKHALQINISQSDH